ncbi:hypothetical protein [Marinilabilia sp.]
MITMEALLIILSATWKFAATFPVAIYVFEMTFIETILFTNAGGIIGVIVSLYFSKGLIYIWNKLKSKKVKNKNKRKFSKYNRRLVLIKSRYGMPGIALLTPVILSIPVGTFLTAKYYGNKKQSYLLLILSQVAWSLIYTLILTQFQISF